MPIKGKSDDSARNTTTTAQAGRHVSGGHDYRPPAVRQDNPCEDDVPAAPVRQFGEFRYPADGRGRPQGISEELRTAGHLR